MATKMTMTVGLCALFLIAADDTSRPLVCQTHEDCMASNEYCAKEVGDCDGQGVCTPRPAACITLFDPVCGCDGKTYGNGCAAAAEGVNVAYLGECKAAEYCFDNDMCGEGRYCFFADCLQETGVCKDRPQFCTYQWDPVCGCDGRTYGNSCAAAASGMSVDYEGWCKSSLE